MNLLRKLTAKPWEHAGELDGIHGGSVVDRPASRTGLYMFIGVMTSMFLLFSISHQMRATYPDWKAVAEPAILWFNTAILILASISLQLANNTAKKDSGKAARIYLAAGVIFTIVFFVGQVLAWQQMIEAGLFAYSNPANAFFYMFTALHGAHLLGGLWFLLGAVRQAGKQTDDDTALVTRISLCTTYWHYLFLVWVLLFYLLLSS